MARVAVVTGGTRGIGRAIAAALKDAGYKVAANYGSDDKNASQFAAESGIPVFKFDVADWEACAAGIKVIEASLGPVEVLVNNGGITLNAVAPGYVDTEMVRAVPKDVLEKIVARIPVGRLGKAEDIARTVLFLVADDADFITGSTLSVNGGQHMY